MNVPIRILGIVTAVFWIILLAFIASAGYAIKDVNFDVGKPEFATLPSGDIRFSLPLYVDNAGYYDLKGFNITTLVYNEFDDEIAKDSAYVPIISKGHNASIIHNVTLNIEQLSEKNSQLLFNDTKLNIVAAAGFDFAELMPTQLSTNFTYPWGAPLSNLEMGQPQFSSTGQQTAQITLPLTFENHAVFDIVGTVSARISDNSGRTISESQAPIEVPTRTHFAGELPFPISADSGPQSITGGKVELFFYTPLFEYGPVVIPYG